MSDDESVESESAKVAAHVDVDPEAQAEAEDHGNDETADGADINSNESKSAAPDADEASDNDDNEEESDDESDNDNDNDEEEEEQQEEEEDQQEEEEEETKPSEQTDEFGRPLSAYEIMRLERIKRNQAYLAKLGLEADAKNGKKGTLLGEDSTTVKKKKIKKKKAAVVLRRSSVSRKTKAKAIDYADKPVKQKSDLLKEKTPKKVKKERVDNKREDRVPLFIYRELKNLETSKKQNLRMAEKFVRAAEVEVKMAKRQVETLEKKEKRRWEKETRNDLLPIVQDLDKRRGDIIKGLKRVDEVAKKGGMNIKERKVFLENKLVEAEQRFPVAIEEAECALGQMLFERLPPSCFENNGAEKQPKSKLSKKSKKKGKKAGAEPAELEELTVPVALTINLDLEELRKVEQNLKVRVQKGRNVGGPVTKKFAAAVQRKWMEGDGPVAASFNEYVPQVGDTVL